MGLRHAGVTGFSADRQHREISVAGDVPELPALEFSLAWDQAGGQRASSEHKTLARARSRVYIWGIVSLHPGHCPGPVEVGRA
jgi:hypothetical protein